MAEWFKGNVLANGVRLHYHRTGGDNPALVISTVSPIWALLGRASPAG